MTNADKFKHLFGIYATELWAMSESDFLEWLNEDVQVMPTTTPECSCCSQWDKIKEALMGVADIIPHCDECKYTEQRGWALWCRAWNRYTAHNGFCHQGKRIE